MKGQDLKENPRAQLNFYWKFKLRQVRVWGTVTKLSPEESAQYWDSRPKESQLSALASHQSHKIQNHKELEEKVKSLRLEYKDKKIPCPAFWGGYHLKPYRFEFWQARANRLHDRYVYELKDNDLWQTYWLAP